MRCTRFGRQRTIKPLRLAQVWARLVASGAPPGGVPMPTGRPSLYSPELVAEICERISCGERLAAICRDPAMPCRTAVFCWLRKHPEFRRQYEHACEARTDIWAERIIEIAASRDDRNVQSRKLEIDVLKC